MDGQNASEFTVETNVLCVLCACYMLYSPEDVVSIEEDMLACEQRFTVAWCELCYELITRTMGRCANS